MMSIPSVHDRAETQARFEQWTAVLNSQGVRPALALLLSWSDYRCIGIFRFQAGKATAVVHYDRLQPQVLTTDEVADTATYCCYVRDSRGAFTTAHALLDERLQGHPAQPVVQAYCGVPILSPEGQLLGTLCCYDMVERCAEQLDMALLLQVASALQQGQHVPPYPHEHGAVVAAPDSIMAALG